MGLLYFYAINYEVTKTKKSAVVDIRMTSITKKYIQCSIVLTLEFLQQSAYQRFWTFSDWYRVLHRLSKAKFAHGGLILSSGQFSLHAPAASENEVHFKSGQNRLENNLTHRSF